MFVNCFPTLILQSDNLWAIILRCIFFCINVNCLRKVSFHIFRFAEWECYGGLAAWAFNHQFQLFWWGTRLMLKIFLISILQTRFTLMPRETNKNSLQMLGVFWNLEVIWTTVNRFEFILGWSQYLVYTLSFYNFTTLSCVLISCSQIPWVL